jgi:PAS domain S-box-containing protein/putative nucleotidyltransferase with HDIG domain
MLKNIIKFFEGHDLLSFQIRDRSLARQLIVSVMRVSLVFILLSTAAQMYIEYWREMNLIDARLQGIDASYLDSLASSLWELDEDLIQTQLNGLINLPDIQYVEIHIKDKSAYTAGEQFASSQILIRDFPLEYTNHGQVVVLGNLEVGVSLSDVYWRVGDHLLIALVMQALLVFLLSGFILLISDRLITHPLDVIARYTRQLELDTLTQPLMLGPRFLSNPHNELGQVAVAINAMRERLAQSTAVRQQSEEALKESEKQFRLLAENSTDMISRHTPEGRYLYASPACRVLLGYEPEELLGHSAFEFIHPDDLLKIEQSRQMVVEEPVVDVVAFRARRKDGSYIWLESTSHSIKDKDSGEIFEIHVSSRNITERKQAEDALRESEERLKEAQRMALIGSWELDLVKNELSWSDEVYRIFGIKPEKFGASYEAFLDAVHPDDRESVRHAYTYSLEERVPYEVVYRLVTPNGYVKYVQERCETIYDNEGRPLRSIGTVQDITKNRRAEEHIQNQLERLNALRIIDNAITGSFDLRLVLNIVLEQVITQLRVDAACILLFNQNTRMLTFASGRGFRTGAIQSANLRLTESFAGEAVLKRSMIQISDPAQIQEDPFFSTFLEKEGFTTYYGLPLLAKGNVVGVLEVYHRTYFEIDDEWRNFLQALAGQTAIAVDNAGLFEDLQRSNFDLTLAYDATIEGWSRALDLRDRETEGHTQRVTTLTIELARRMGIPDAGIVHIRRGALLHDIGKMGVPDRILHKPDVLTPEEWDIMRQHTIYANDMLCSIQYLKPALDIPQYHHEKWDGTGYPQKLKGEGIPLAARIFAVVDVWDALTSDRPYRAAWSKEKAIEYIKSETGKHFDPKIVEIFLPLISSK